MTDDTHHKIRHMTPDEFEGKARTLCKILQYHDPESKTYLCTSPSMTHPGAYTIHAQGDFEKILDMVHSVVMHLPPEHRYALAERLAADLELELEPVPERLDS